jgi:hypothetical protein
VAACPSRARSIRFGLAECLAGELANLASDDTLTCIGRVQVDQRSPRGVVAHSRHQLTEIRTRFGGELVARVPQVVKVDAI